MNLEYRLYHRKSIVVDGICFDRKKKKYHGIIIKNISIQGLCFELSDAYLPVLPVIYPKDKILFVEFKLTDQDADFITKKCIVREVDHFRVGVEFIDDAYSAKIGFFLMK